MSPGEKKKILKGSVAVEIVTIVKAKYKKNLQ